LPNWVSASMDMTVPNAARVYDYMLGGGHNFAADRAFAEEMERIMPGATAYASATRAFVHRAVRRLIEQGVRQFLDIGSGIPTVGNVHEIARSATPEARVVYIDIDPVAVAHSEALLVDDPHTQVFQADLARPDQMLSHPGVLDLLDLTQPVAVLLNAVVHFLPDTAHPERVIAQIRDAVAPGSYLTLTHGTPIEHTELSDQQNRARELYRRTPTALYFRTPEQIRNLLAGWNLAEPGLVPVADWNPAPDLFQPATPGMLAAVGHKP
jgi:O-methyltransferase involved in polyketide biosynthesis